MAEYVSLNPTVSHGIANSFEMLFHDDLNRTHSRRLTAYRRYWLFYLGKHWTYVRDPGEPTITINYARRILDIHNNFTFKNGFKVVIPDDPATKENEQEDREFIRNMLEETWRKNSKELWCLEAGQQGGVTGDVFARVSWEKNDPLEDPYARVDIIPSHLCFPEFGGPTGVDRKKLKRIMIVTPIFRPKGGTAMSSAFFMNRTKTQAAMELVIKSEVWSAPILEDGKVIVPAKVQYFEDREPLGPEKDNPLGEIPVVHLPNYPLSGEFYGISDLVDAIELNRELNEKATDISDIINYHGSPTTVITGAKVKDLDKGPNRTWGLPEGATVKNLELSGDLEAANNHWNVLKQSMLELTGTPEQALGKVQNVSNTSGVALQIQYLPMMEKRDIKVMTYGLGIRKINRLMIMITEMADSGFASKMRSVTGNRYRNDVVFPDPMPQDEMRELEKARSRIELALTTRRRELERMGHSQAEIDAIIADSLKEMEESEEAMFSAPTPGPGRGRATLNRGGSPDTRGMKIDETLRTKAETGE